MYNVHLPIMLESERQAAYRERKKEKKKFSADALVVFGMVLDGYGCFNGPHDGYANRSNSKTSLPLGHRPVNVKRAVIGSKGGWKLSTIFLSCKVFYDRPIIKLGNILYLLDGSIFAVLFGTTSHCFC